MGEVEVVMVVPGETASRVREVLVEIVDMEGMAVGGVEGEVAVPGVRGALLVEGEVEVEKVCREAVVSWVGQVLVEVREGDIREALLAVEEVEMVHGRGSLTQLVLSCLRRRSMSMNRKNCSFG